jgi:hypothetical protein
MGELFLFSFFVIAQNFNSELVFLFCIIAIFILTIFCVVIALCKTNYSVKDRLWALFINTSILLFDFWFEQFVKGEIKYFILVVAIECISLSLCLFVNKKEHFISDEKKSLANFFSKCALNQNINQNYNQNYNHEQDGVISEVIKLEQKEDRKGEEIDFSHVKSVLRKLDYYPLKEQDKRSAKQLENAINQAQENGLDESLKQTINDGLGQLLKLMSKYAV